mmetsp:Transcript_27926/g.91073  ORF Transcript_27926/g.91073 Transcript_27926/m.91073 type:complete len:460 (+) Transcript_27926:366-1745(+)
MGASAPASRIGSISSWLRPTKLRIARHALDCMRGSARCWLSALTMAGMPPHSAMAAQFSGMRSAMLPSAETPSVCIDPTCACSSIACTMAMWPLPSRIDSLHLSLPEMFARKKHACLATCASVTWFASSLIASLSASIFASCWQIVSVTVRRDSVASSSESGPADAASGERAASSSSGSKPNSTAAFACSWPFEVRARASSASVEARTTPHAARIGPWSAHSVRLPCLRTASTASLSTPPLLTSVWRCCSCTSIAARSAWKHARSGGPLSACTRATRTRAAQPRTPKRSLFSASISSTVSASRTSTSAAVPAPGSACTSASDPDTSESTADVAPASVVASAGPRCTSRFSAAAASPRAVAAPPRAARKVSRITPPPYRSSSLSSSSRPSTHAARARASRTAAGSSSADAPGTRRTMLDRLMPCDVNCSTASSSASSGAMSRSSMFSLTASSNVSCEMRA